MKNFNPYPADVLMWWAPNYVSRWQIGFNLAFKGLNLVSFIGSDFPASKAKTVPCMKMLLQGKNPIKLYYKESHFYTFQISNVTYYNHSNR